MKVLRSILAAGSGNLRGRSSILVVPREDVTGIAERFNLVRRELLLFLESVYQSRTFSTVPIIPHKAQFPKQNSSIIADGANTPSTRGGSGKQNLWLTSDLHYH